MGGQFGLPLWQFGRPLSLELGFFGRMLAAPCAIVPPARKAALWDGYRRRHAEIRSRAEEDARSLFAEGFARGYATSHGGIPMQRATPAEGGEARR